MPTKGPGLDSPDTAEWMKPTREKGSNAGVPQSRDISKAIENEHRARQNPSR